MNGLPMHRLIRRFKRQVRLDSGAGQYNNRDAIFQFIRGFSDKEASCQIHNRYADKIKRR